MQGVIVDVGTGQRVVRGDDGGKYPFAPVSWLSDDVSPEPGVRVGFRVQGANAVDVYALSGESAPVVSSTDQVPSHRRRKGTGRKRRRWALPAGAIVLLAILGVCSGFFAGADGHGPLSGPDPNAPEQVRLYDEMIDAGFSTEYASVYTEQVLSGESPTFSHAYATQIVTGESETHARVYAELIDVGRLHWYAYPYAELIDLGESPTYARAFVEQVDAGYSPLYDYVYPSYVGPGVQQGRAPNPEKGYAHVYAELVEAGKSSTYARAYADARFLYELNEERAREIAEEADPASSFAPTNAAVVLAMYSTTDDVEAGRRAASVREMTTYVGSGDMDTDRALELLNDLAPEASIDEREIALDRLASIADGSDGELTSDQSTQVANELTRLVTGHGIDAEQRTEAAREMLRLSQAGELNADNAAGLMDTIAPEWSVAERKEALGYLAWQFAHGDWDAEGTQRTAEEGYTLITGGELRLERRMEAGVELVGEGLKRFGGDSFDDESVDQATELIKGAISGELSTASVSKTLGLDTGESSRSSNGDGDDAYRRAYNDKYGKLIAIKVKWDCPSARDGLTCYRQKYSRRYASKRAGVYAEQIVAGRSERYADIYAKHVADGRSADYAHVYAEQILAGKSTYDAQIAANATYHILQDWRDSDTYVRIHAEQMAAGKSCGYARTYAEQIVDGKSEEYAHVYAQQIGAGRLPRYAHGYALSLVTHDRDDTYAKEYAHAYGQTILPGYWRTHASIYAKEFETSDPDWYASIHVYAEQILAGKSGKYARAYTEQIIAGKSERYARAYLDQIAAGKAPAYAGFYAWLVDLVD